MSLPPAFHLMPSSISSAVKGLEETSARSIGIKFNWKSMKKENSTLHLSTKPQLQVWRYPNEKCRLTTFQKQKPLYLFLKITSLWKESYKFSRLSKEIILLLIKARIRTDVWTANETHKCHHLLPRRSCSSHSPYLLAPWHTHLSANRAGTWQFRIVTLVSLTPHIKDVGKNKQVGLPSLVTEPTPNNSGASFRYTSPWRYHFGQMCIASIRSGRRWPQ